MVKLYTYLSTVHIPIVQSLAVSVGKTDIREWDKFVEAVQISLNTMLNKGISRTSMKALLGYDIENPANSRLLNEIKNQIGRFAFRGFRYKISKYITAEQAKQQERYDRARKEATKYEKGDVVLLQITNEVATGTSRKLRPKHKGPYVVTKVLGNDRYEVEDMRDQGRQRKTVMASERMLPWTTTC